jgi:hypothetical protein
MPKAARSKNPLQGIAATAAEEYFAAIVNHHDLGDVFDPMQSPLDEAIEEITNLLEDERGKHPPSPHMERWHIGVRAGYLVGVQVGLRLRGGAR